jgi:hypothetical protein
MATITVKQTGGDYSSLNAALAAANTGDLISIEGAWTADDTSTCTVADNNLTIQVTDYPHPGHYEPSKSFHHRLKTATTAHSIQVNGTGVTFDGLVIYQNGSGTSAEGFRINNSGTTTIKNCLILCGGNAADQDGIYSYHALTPTVTVENTQISGFTRCGIHYQHYAPQTPGTVTFNVNSCSIFDNDIAGVGLFMWNSATYHALTANIHNSLIMGNTRDYGQWDYYTEYNRITNWTVNTSYTIDSDNSSGATGVTVGAGCLASRTLTDTRSPSTGNWVIVEDKTTFPYDLRLVDHASENDAKDAHTTATAHGLTIPSTDICGSSRPQNTSYDIGMYELQGGSGHTALEFNDANSNIRAGSDTSIDDLPSGSAMTVEGWFRTHAGASSQQQIQLINKGQWANSGWIFYSYGSIDRLSVLMRITGSNQEFSVNSVGFVDGDWHHIAWTLSIDDKIRIFLDGSRVYESSGTFTQANYTSDAAQDLQVGTVVGQVRNPYIDVGWIRISNSVRYSGTTYTVPAQNSPPSSDANTKVLWHVDETKGAWIEDHSSNSNHGELNNLQWIQPSGTTHNLVANGIQSTPVVGKPAIGQTHVLTANGLQSTPVVGKPAIGQTHILTANGLQSTPELGTPQAGTIHALVANGLQSTPNVDTPAIGQTHILAANDLESTPQLDTPSIGQVHQLQADGVVSQPDLDAPSIGQTHVLTANGLQSTPELGRPSMGAVHDLVADGLQSTPELGTPAIGQTHVLVADDISSTPELGTPELGVIHALEARGLEVTGNLDTPAIGQTHVLTPVGLEVQPVLGRPLLGTGVLLEAQGLQVTPTVDTPAIGQTHILEASDLETTPELGTPEVGQIHTLTAEGLQVGAVLGTPAIGQVHQLAASGLEVQPVLGKPRISTGLVEGFFKAIVHAFRPEPVISVLRPEIHTEVYKPKVQIRTYDEE